MSSIKIQLNWRFFFNIGKQKKGEEEGREEMKRRKKKRARKKRWAEN